MAEKMVTLDQSQLSNLFCAMVAAGKIDAFTDSSQIKRQFEALAWNMASCVESVLEYQAQNKK